MTIFKKFLMALILTAIIIPINIYAESIDSLTEKSLAKLTVEYLKKYPADGMKRGLSVLPFKNESAASMKSGLGNTLSQIFSDKITASQVFYLIDRENLNDRIKEIELSQTGLTDEATTIAAGKETGVSVFMSGSISELGNDFQITVKLINTENGSIVAQENILISQTALLKKQESIAYATIAEYGIGLNYQTSYFIHPTPMSGVTLLNDIYVSYRPILPVNIKLGVTHMYMEMWDDSKVNVTSVYPNYKSPSVVDATTLQSGYSNGKMQNVAPTIGMEYNWLPTSKFSISAGLTATLFIPGSLKLEQIFTGNPVRFHNDPTNSYINNTMVLTQTFNTAAMFRAELKPQFFISPRAMLGLYLAFIYTTPLTVERVDFGDGVAIYPHDTEGAIDQNDTHLGFNPLQLGLGSNIEDDLVLMGGAVGLSVSFYF